MVLFVSALSWLFLATVFGLIASLKFHMPQFLAGVPEPDLRRRRSVASRLRAYTDSRCRPELHSCLWLFVRMGRTPAASPIAMTIAASFYNFAVTIGVFGMLAGDSTGFQNFEFPPYAAWTMWISFIVMGIITVLTYSNRDEQQTYPSQWFGLTALFWFAWICGTALLLLLERNQCAALCKAQSTGGTFITCTALCSGLSAWLPSSISFRNCSAGPLFSRPLALFAFWMLCLFGSWGGVPNGSPLPAWIPAMSTVGIVLTTIPVIAIAVEHLANSSRQS